MTTLAGARTMQAAVYHEYGPPDRVLELDEVLRPEPEANELLVQVRASAVNPGDWHFVKGEPYVMRLLSGVTGPRHTIPGLVVSGVVESAGRAVTKFAPGDEIYGEIPHGGFAEYAVIDAGQASSKPPRLTFEEAAAVPLVGVTALQGLRDHGKVAPGQKVLINGASGGVGTFALQIAKLLGAEVTGVCSTRNLPLVRSLGADFVVDYTDEDFVAGGPRFDVILDNVGNRSIGECRRALAPGGTYLPNSAAGGPWLGGLGRVAKSKALSPFVRHRLRPFVSSGASEDLDILGQHIEAGDIRPVVDRVYPLSAAAAALAHYGTGHARGKVVLTI